MKSSVIVAVLLGLLVVVASAHDRHGGHHGGRPSGPHTGHHEGHKGAAADKPAFCSYKNTKGHTFDFSHLASKDMLVKDMVGGSTYHFNPCGSVHATQCPSGSAVCEITSKGAAISHGLASNAHWADGVESGASVEVIYGGGELCAEGEHRKTAVEMRCLPSANSKEGASFLMGIIKEDCFLKLIVESPLACDMEAVCSAIKTEDACQANSDLCDWKHGLCAAAENKDHGLFSSRKQIATFVISAFIGFTVVVSLCCVATCACIACRRVVRRRRSLPTYKKAKKTSKKAGKKVAAEELNLITPETFENVIPENHYPFQAYAMQQAADGSFVPVPVHMPMPPHAYSYPMVMQATYHNIQQQPTQQ